MHREGVYMEVGVKEWWVCTRGMCRESVYVEGVRRVSV